MKPQLVSVFILTFLAPYIRRLCTPYLVLPFLHLDHGNPRSTLPRDLQVLTLTSWFTFQSTHTKAFNLLIKPTQQNTTIHLQVCEAGMTHRAHFLFLFWHFKYSQTECYIHCHLHRRGSTQSIQLFHKYIFVTMWMFTPRVYLGKTLQK